MKRIGIVCSKFNDELTGKMLETALHRAGEKHALVVSVMRVPGAFEIPFAVQEMLSRRDVDAVVTLGAVIHGDTSHDEVIMHAIAQELLYLSLHFHKPVSLGVSGPKMDYAQAKARAVPYAIRAVDAVLEMLHHEPKHSLPKPSSVKLTSLSRRLYSHATAKAKRSRK